MDWRKTDVPQLARRMHGWFRRSHRDEVNREWNLRLEERRRERTRIAQELHDTLLQEFLSASMQLHIAYEQLPADSPVKPALHHVLELMAKGIADGRAALQGLHSVELASLTLEEALADLGHEFKRAGRPSFRILVMGQPRPFDPGIQEHIYLIAREALLNALRHSNATTVEAELEYLPGKFRVVVRDDGSGIDPQVLLAAQGSHWGVLGMRERAATIGAQLRVWTKPGAGTEVELSFPTGARPSRNP